PDGRFLYYQTVRFEVRIVLRVGDCALQRFADQKRRFLRSERKQIERRRNRQTLNLTGDFAHLEGRNPRIFVCRSNFHCFAELKWLKGLQRYKESPSSGRFNFVTLLTFLTIFILNSHRVAHPPGGGPPL